MLAAARLQEAAAQPAAAASHMPMPGMPAPTMPMPTMALPSLQLAAAETFEQQMQETFSAEQEKVSLVRRASSGRLGGHGAVAARQERSDAPVNLRQNQAPLPAP